MDEIYYGAQYNRGTAVKGASSFFQCHSSFGMIAMVTVEHECDSERPTPSRVRLGGTREHFLYTVLYLPNVTTLTVTFYTTHR